MLNLIAEITPRPDHLADATDAIRSILRVTRAEPGCLRFDLYATGEKLLLVEAWRDEAALERHHQAPYTRAVFAAYEDWLAEPLVLHRGATIDAPVELSPEAVASTRPERSALVFVEFQHEWLDPASTLRTHLVADADAFERAVERAADVLCAAREAGWTVVHAGLDLQNDPTYLTFGGRALGLRGAIPRAGTWTGHGARFAEPFVPRDDEIVVAGRTGASVLQNSTLDAVLRNHGIDTLFLAGFATHVCIESSLRQAHDMGYDAYVIEDACAAFERSQHQHVMDHVVHHFGGRVGAEALQAHLRQNPRSESRCSS